MVRSWGKPGAWAEEAERAEAEAAAAAAAAAAIPPAAVALMPAESFPSLGEAVAQKPKKKKGQTFSISELAIGKYVGPGGKMRTGMSDMRGLTPEEMMMLPTGPRERSEEEQHYSGIGGGFKDYGGGYRDRGSFRGERDQEGGGFGGARDRDSAPRPYESRGYGDRAGYDDERRREHASDRDLPSRADEVDNWGSGKKLTVGYDDERRRERISDRDLPSRADEVDDWGSGKKFVPSERPDQRSRMSMRDDRREGGYDSHVSKADTEDWGARKKLMPAAERGTTRQMPVMNADRWPRRDMHVEESRPSERPRLKLQPRTQSLPDSESSASHGEADLPSPSISQQGDSGFSQQEVDTAPSKSTKPSPFGAAKPREEVLAEKGQDWRKLDGELESKSIQSGPSSTHSSRPGTPDVSKPRPKVDPFGNAKPREVLLQERGQDWRKIDFELEHKSVNRAETEQEIKLKEEIKSLEEQLKSNADETKMNGFAGEHQDSVSLKEQLAQKEKELVRLTRELDDKVRFSQRTSEHGDTWSERPPSRRGSRDLSQRPRSALSDSGSQYEPSSGWPGERPLSRSGSRDLDDRARVYQERPSSRDYSYGARRDGRAPPPDVWVADRPPSRTGSRRNGRPPSRGSRDEPVSQFEPESRKADIWRRPVDNDNRARGSQYERNRLDRW